MSRPPAAAAVAALALAAAAAGGLVEPRAFFAAWLGAFLLWTGLGLGALALLMIGHLLDELWLAPVRTELEGMARSLPLAALFSVPLAFGLGELYPWAGAPAVAPDPIPAARAAWLAPAFVLARSALYLILWSTLALIVTRPGSRHRTASAVGLILLVPTVTLASLDWIMSLDPRWLSSLFGLAFGMTQMVAALALAVLLALRRAHPEPPHHLETLTKVLLWLALGAAHLWFAQYLIVWSANLPHEVSWYLLRGDGWAWAKLGFVVPATTAALVLLLPHRIRRLRTGLAAVLLLAQHAVHMAWLVRPDLATPPVSWLDPLVAIGLFGLWAALAPAMLPRRETGEA